MTEIRKLSAILFADIAGYRALMQSDETKALTFLSYFKGTLEKETAVHQGQIIQFFGDGCLLSFDSSMHGVDCAIALQKSFIEKEIPVPKGILLDDVDFKDDNVFGDRGGISAIKSLINEMRMLLTIYHVESYCTGQKSIRI